jgi:hypothetical protein
LKKLKKGLLQIYGDQVAGIMLYGSRARGDARSDSDIDILIVLKDDFNYSEMLRLSSDFAASRAYSSLFYTAEALLLSRGLSYSSHPAVIASFGKEFC